MLSHARSPPPPPCVFRCSSRARWQRVLLLHHNATPATSPAARQPRGSTSRRWTRTRSPFPHSTRARGRQGATGGVGSGGGGRHWGTQGACTALTRGARPAAALRDVRRPLPLPNQSDVSPPPIRPLLSSPVRRWIQPRKKSRKGGQHFFLKNNS